MLFRSRETPGFYERVRRWAWPRTSWHRSIRYFSKRIVRLTASPHAVAAGVAAGVFASATPFLGFHLVITIVLAYLLRGNMLAGVIGSFVGNPVTLPIFWFADYEVGNFILGKRPPPVDDAASGSVMDKIGGVPFWSPDQIGPLIHKVWPILLPTAIGSLIVGVAMALIFYVGVRFGLQAYQGERRRRLLERRSATGAEPG
jgi:uncharacterized protein (DUF2062 family)